jgi:hypothetical protein
MPAPPSPLLLPKLLVGEGIEEKRFFTALLKHLKIDDVQVEECGGKARLPAYLKTLVTARAGYQDVISLAVVRDADANASAAFMSVRSALQKVHLGAPPRPREFAGEAPRVGVFIMPDGKSPGMLEDLCLHALQSDGAIPCVQELFQCLDRQQLPQPENMSKARLQAWLATRKQSGKRLSEAAESGFFDWSNTAFDPLKNFLFAL